MSSLWRNRSLAQVLCKVPLQWSREKPRLDVEEAEDSEEEESIETENLDDDNLFSTNFIHVKRKNEP
eukprot:6189769-Ditylum_brightwellii.AAC.1